jgi:hypothetical protein
MGKNDGIANYYPAGPTGTDVVALVICSRIILYKISIEASSLIISASWWPNRHRASSPAFKG